MSDQHPGSRSNSSDACTGHQHHRDHRHHDHQHEHEERHHDCHHDHYDHNNYQGVPYPLPQALQSREEHTRDLLDGTLIKTRDAILIALALSGAIATEYVKIAKIENSIDIVKSEVHLLQSNVKEIRANFKILKLENQQEIDNLEEADREHKDRDRDINTVIDKRLDFVEGKVSDLMFSDRRSKK